MSSYQRHRLEQAFHYQIIEQHYPDFLSAMEAQERPLPSYVAVGWSAGRPNAGVDGCDQAIRLA